MKITVYGAGAIGGHLATRLGQLEGLTLSVVARGAHLAAIQRDGLTLHLPAGNSLHTRPDAAVADSDALPPQDIVFVTLKAPSLPEAAAAIGRLVKPDGCVVFFTNGLPWWMGLAQGSRLDPEGRLRAEVGLARTVGGIVYSANAVEAPGVVRHRGWDQWVMGEPDGSPSARVEMLRDLLAGAGLNAQASQDIRRAVWLKLVYNASGNPLAALTRLWAYEVAEHPDLGPLSLAIRREIAAIAAACGVSLAGEPALESMDDVKQPSPIRPSMLQDVANGKPMEVEAILGEAAQIATAQGVPTPAITAVLAMLRGLDQFLRSGRTLD